MKKAVFIAMCTISIFIFSSCGSSKPCGLATKTKQTKQNHQSEIIVADASIN